MRAGTSKNKVALVVVVAATSAMLADTGKAARSWGHAGSVAGKCATVKVSAKPSLNTAMIPETLKSSVTSCSSHTETVTLVQRITSDTTAPTTKQWTITLLPGKTVAKTRSFPYACCGSYTVTDKVRTASGALAKGTASFTFA
jgi:hypothetical protein